MSEKSELPPDNMSLPPNYAPSETYTESPPPAYRAEKSAYVYIARMVCFTILAAAFLTGFFILVSTWLNTRACNCDNAHVHTFDNVQAAGLLGKMPDYDDTLSTNKIDQKWISNSEIENNIKEEKEEKVALGITKPDQSLEALEEEVVRMEQIEEEAEKESELIEDSFKNQIKELKKKIKLPIDMLLGNPALNGKDVQCDVERRVHDMGGFAANAIIVTCKDEDDDSQEIDAKPKSSIKPPLSFLAPIMKMIAAKVKASKRNDMNKPNIVVHPLSGSMPRPLESHVPLLPFGGPKPFIKFGPPNVIPINNFNIGPQPEPFMGPMPKIIESGTIHNPIRRLDGGIMHPPMMRNNIMQNSFNGPAPPPPQMINGPFINDIINHLPFPQPMNNQVIRIQERKAFPLRPFGNNPPMPFQPFQGPIQNLPFLRPLPNDIEPHHHRDEPHHHGEEPHHENHHPQIQSFPQPPPPPPVQQPEFQPLNTPPVPIKEIIDIVEKTRSQNLMNQQSHPRNGRLLEPPTKPEPIVGSRPNDFPFPLPENVFPITPISSERNSENRPPLMVRVLKNLLAPDAPFPKMEKQPEMKPIMLAKPFIMSPQNFLPLARGIPFPENDPREEDNEEFPHPVPEASGRALPDPVNLPKIKFLPGRILRLPLAPGLQSLPDIIQKRIITHMELKEAPKSEDDLPEQPKMNLEPPAINDEEFSDKTDTETEFGPPREHTVLEENSEEQMENESSEPSTPYFPPIFSSSHPPLPFHNADFPPPPPPFMRKEGRSGIIPEINEDSEIISDVPIETTGPIEIKTINAEEPVVEDQTKVHSNNRHVILLN